MEKHTAKESASYRLPAKLISQIRQKAKQDYGDEKFAGLVVEDGMTKYLASELTGDQIEALLSATEGALFNRINKKFEKEFNSLVDRIGDLVAKGSYYSLLNTLLTEEMYFNQRYASKEKYNDMRGKAAKILSDRYKEAGNPQAPQLLEQNQKLEKQVEELQKKVKELEGQREDIKSELEQLQQDKQKSDQVSQQYKAILNYLISKQEKSITGKTTLPKSIQELIEEFTERR